MADRVGATIAIGGPVPARRIRGPGESGDGSTGALNADGGYACISADDIRQLGLADLKSVPAFLDLFNDPNAPPLTVQRGAAPSGCAALRLQRRMEKGTPA